MLREHRDLIRRIHLLLSTLCVFLAWGGAYLGLRSVGFVVEAPEAYFVPCLLFSGVVVLMFSFRKYHPGEHLIYSFKAFREICCAVLAGMFFLAFVFYFSKAKYISRAYLLTSGALSLGVLFFWHLFVMEFYREIRKRGRNFQHLLLVGNGYTLPGIIQSIKNNPSLGQKIEAVLLTDRETSSGDAFLRGLKVYFGKDQLLELLNAHVVDNALFTVYRQDPGEIEKAMLLCRERGVNVWLKPDFLHGTLLSSVDYLADIPLFVFSLGPRESISLVVKRFLDVVFSAFLILLLLFPMVVIALFVKATPGPIFFIQKRVGLNGRRFLMAKFRTMYKDSEQRRAEYNLKNEMKGPVFKMKDDPRITPVGRFLRKYSLDELPQFWSVLLGDMSMVGPRPPIPTEVELYQGWQRRRLSMRPGITCIWQVTGRNKITDFSEWAKLDLKYIDEWSLLLDIKILIKTIPAVIQGTGI